MDIKCESEANLCHKSCSYEEALKLVPDWFIVPTITLETKQNMALLSKFMNWLHFNKHVIFMKREKQKAVPDMTAWKFYFDEFLELDKLTEDKATVCESCAMNRVISHIMGDYDT